MEINRPDPGMHYWLILALKPKNALNSMPVKVYEVSSIFFMQRWGKQYDIEVICFSFLHVKEKTTIFRAIQNTGQNYATNHIADKCAIEIRLSI